MLNQKIEYWILVGVTQLENKGIFLSPSQEQQRQNIFASHSVLAISTAINLCFLESV